MKVVLISARNVSVFPTVRNNDKLGFASPITVIHVNMKLSAIDLQSRLCENHRTYQKYFNNRTFLALIQSLHNLFETGFTQVIKNLLWYASGLRGQRDAPDIDCLTSYIYGIIEFLFFGWTFFTFLTKSMLS